MRNIRYWVVAAVLAGGFSTALQAASVEERLDRVERVLSSQSLLEMLERLDALQREVQLLRGQVEEQQHTITGLKERQRELYLDIDRRLSRFEREGGMAAPAAVAGPGVSDATPLIAGSSAAHAGAAAPAQAAKPAAPSDAARAQQERQAFQQAFDMLRELRYTQATAAFRDFLKQYPDGNYAHIAQYWLGEAGYAQRDFRQAIDDYTALLTNYPNSPKRAEAMLKIGYSHYELKEADKARAILDQLVKEYPDSTEAGQARNLLKRITRNAN